MGRPRKVAQAGGGLVVVAENAVFDGKGGFHPVGAKFNAADEAAEKSLIDKGYAKHV